MKTRFPKTTTLILTVCAGLTLPLALSSAGRSSAEPAASAAPVANKYIGAAKCKNCHSSAESGDQYGAWSKALHAHAFESLASEASKTLATAQGIDDPTKADACLECHVTGFGVPEDTLSRGWKQELGVQCETCHGPNGDHMKARFKAASSGEKPEGYQGVATEEVVVSPGADVCVKCHNPQSPSYKPFCYFEARGKIAHLNPQKPRTDEEKANYGKCPHGSPCPHAEGCPDGTCNLKPDELTAMKK